MKYNRLLIEHLFFAISFPVRDKKMIAIQYSAFNEFWNITDFTFTSNPVSMSLVSS